MKAAIAARVAGVPGTRDPTPWLCFEAAARAHDAFGGPDLMARNRDLAADGARMIASALDVQVAGAYAQCIGVRSPASETIVVHAVHAVESGEATTRFGDDGSESRHVPE